MKRLLLLPTLLWGICVFGQPTPATDFLEAEIAIRPNTTSSCLQGEASYSFRVLKPSDSVFLDAVGMNFTKVLLNGKKVRHKNSGKQISLYKKLRTGKTYKIYLEYSACPRQTVYFMGWEDSVPTNNEIWTQGQGKYTSHWAPSFDAMIEKVEFDLSITFDKEYEVASNGRLLGVYEEDGLKTWQFDMQHPMSSYLLAFAIGKYQKKEIQSASGIPIQLYYKAKDSSKVEPTYRYSREIFDFLEKKIGIPYPWQVYRQVPVRDFLYAGMENTGCTIFSDAYMIDSLAFKDRNYVNINAHELAHQWFGNLVTEVSGSHHWLHEGFATFYAYLAEKEFFGDDYFYWRLYDTAKALDRMTSEGGGEALTDAGAGSLTFYEKGAWAFYMLREQIGSESFDRAVHQYLLTFAYSNARIEDLLDAMEKSSGTSLDSFKEIWLNGTEFPFKEAMEQLERSSAGIKNFRAMHRELIGSSLRNEPIIEKYWEQNPSGFWQESVIKTYFNSLSPGFIKKALDGGDLKVRRAIARETVQIPSELKQDYESLLLDNSYVTREAVLYKLWIYFDEDRKNYLDQCRDIKGLPNFNLRLLWLTLAILTPAYDEALKPDYFKELCGYTNARYNFEIRQLAFQYLKEAFYFTDDNLKDLAAATVHHSWQFRSYARGLMDELLKKEQYKAQLRKLMHELKEAELRYLRTKLTAE